MNVGLMMSDKITIYQPHLNNTAIHHVKLKVEVVHFGIHQFVSIFNGPSIGKFLKI